VNIVNWNCAEDTPGVYLARIAVKDADGQARYQEIKKTAVIKQANASASGRREAPQPEVA
jgi:hypothetical protein